MGDPDAPQLDQAQLVRALIDHGVRFILVGGAGANAHGSQRLTTDLDIVPEWTTENLDRLAGALADLGARLRVAGMPDGIEAPLDARMLVAMELPTWRTPALQSSELPSQPGTALRCCNRQPLVPGVPSFCR
jgi:hypothetical protein